MEGEHVLGALPVQWHKNSLNIIPWTIVVTDARIIVARLTPEIQKQAVDAKVKEKAGGSSSVWRSPPPAGSPCMNGTSRWTRKLC